MTTLDAALMTILYDALKVPPPHPVTCKVGEYVIALLGIPLRFNDFVVLDAFAATPAGSAPETMLHLYGVQPPLAWMTAEYATLSVPLGRLVVLIVIDARHGNAETSSAKSSNEAFITAC